MESVAPRIDGTAPASAEGDAYYSDVEDSLEAAAVRSAGDGLARGGIGTGGCGSASDDSINACSVEGATEELSEATKEGMNGSAVLWGNMKMEARYRGGATKYYPGRLVRDHADEDSAVSENLIWDSSRKNLQSAFATIEEKQLIAEDSAAVAEAKALLSSNMATEELLRAAMESAKENKSKAILSCSTIIKIKKDHQVDASIVAEVKFLLGATRGPKASSIIKTAQQEDENLAETTIAKAERAPGLVDASFRRALDFASHFQVSIIQHQDYRSGVPVVLKKLGAETSMNCRKTRDHFLVVSAPSFFNLSRFSLQPFSTARTTGTRAGASHQASHGLWYRSGTSLCRSSQNLVSCPRALAQMPQGTATSFLERHHRPCSLWCSKGIF